MFISHKHDEFILILCIVIPTKCECLSSVLYWSPILRYFLICLVGAFVFNVLLFKLTCDNLR